METVLYNEYKPIIQWKITTRYDTIEEFNVDSKAEYTA